MCGIVGAVAQRDVVPVLLEGLRKLEYRGYDSAGLAGLGVAGELLRARAVGRVVELEAQVKRNHTQVNTGIAHTRWATHGVPSERNAHPHASEGNGFEVAVVHNGIIENHEPMRAKLKALGYIFGSETDTEVIVHMVHYQLTQGNDLLQAVQQTVRELQGLYAIGVVCKQFPGTVIGARQGAPLLVGLGEGETSGENFLGSDASALIQVTRQMMYLEEGDVVQLRCEGVTVFDASGQPVTRAVIESQLSADAVEIGQYAHYMQKEIFEQPGAIANTLEMVANAKSIAPQLFGAEAEAIFGNTKQLLILACGSSYIAGCVAKYWIESLAGISVQVEIASEYRYRDSVALQDTLLVTVSQSGETADTLAALQHAKATHEGMNLQTLSICNVPESALIRQSKLRFLTRAGPEIGVASTKALTTQFVALFLLALVLAKQNGRLAPAREQELLESMRHLPLALQHVLAIEPQVKEWAKHFANKQNALFLGRGVHYPIAMEGALKLKEITYIHAEAYAAGELKHGPLALVDANMPVVVVAPNDALIEKLKSNLQEVRARGGELYVFADRDTHIQAEDGVHVINLLDHAGYLSPILHTVPLQLLAYHTALARGTDVDKPRNLAKSVTVE